MCFAISNYPTYVYLVGGNLGDGIEHPYTDAIKAFTLYQEEKQKPTYGFSGGRTFLAFSVFEKTGNRSSVHVPFDTGKDMLQKVEWFRNKGYHQLFANTEVSNKDIDRALFDGVIFRSEREDGVSLIAEGGGRRRALVYSKRRATS